ncbi:MAG: hypothetical protein JST58_16990 [Bacteroidetes bacterium]|nr:hypothetical protein [Bacteroidota bacterium]
MLYKNNIRLILCLLLTISLGSAFGQTDNDAVMMNKYQWCTGATYMHSQWNSYWEGTFKRTNGNIGTVTTQSVMGMTNYGITNNLNIMAGLPYVWTNASEGTLHGQKGFQDASLFVKWRAGNWKIGPGEFSVFAIGGASTPTSNYIADYLPLSIGLGSTNLTGRLMVYYKSGIFFARASGSYIWRSNIKIDQPSYYTTELINSNTVQMPNLATFNGSLGIFTKYLIAELMVDQMNTLGGFDIRKNDMPFPSNRMNSTSMGIHAKYTFPFFTHISIVGGGDHVLAGRNVGQSTDFNLGAFYALYIKHHSKPTTH